jgi:hypothetical protein
MPLYLLPEQLGVYLLPFHVLPNHMQDCFWMPSTNYWIPGDFNGFLLYGFYLCDEIMMFKTDVERVSEKCVMFPPRITKMHGKASGPSTKQTIVSQGILVASCYMAFSCVMKLRCSKQTFKAWPKNMSCFHPKIMHGKNLGLTSLLAEP